jgi:aerobic-type carbon monoxide dehydrogenase small subunit (CoxS/CutS family)
MPMKNWTSLALRINGEFKTVSFPTHHSLLEVLRERLHLTGTKHGCELGECGACAVLIDGQPVLSCLQLAADLEGREIETVEGLQEGNRLTDLQAGFADLGAAQCGYCTPGILLTAKALIDDNPKPSRSEIQQALAGNLCRCTGYHKIVEAVEWALSRRLDPEARPPARSLHGDELPGEER